MAQDDEPISRDQRFKFIELWSKQRDEFAKIFVTSIIALNSSGIGLIPALITFFPERFLKKQTQIEFSWGPFIAFSFGLTLATMVCFLTSYAYATLSNQQFREINSKNSTLIPQKTLCTSNCFYIFAQIAAVCSLISFLIGAGLLLRYFI